MKYIYFILVVTLSLTFVNCKNKSQSDKLSIDGSSKKTEAIKAKPELSSFLDSIIEDEYWKRGTVVKSSDSNDIICHPRVIEYNSQIHLFYLNAKKKSDPEKYSPIEMVHIVLGESPEIIDTVATSIFDYKSELVYKHSTLQIKGISILYCKEDDSDTSGYKCYRYNLESSKEPKEISEYQFLASKKASAYPMATISHDNKMIAYEYDYRLYIRFGYSYVEEIPSKSPSEIDHHIKNGFEVTRLIENLPSDSVILVGTMSWSIDDSELFFDNSAPDLACIWNVDIKQKRVKKIVPEHEAITPWSFDYNSKRYVIYGYKNQLMIAEKP